MIQKITEIHVSEFDPTVFHNQYFIPHIPLIVRGLFLEDDNYDRWNLDFLLSAVKDVEREVPMTIFEKRENKHEQFFKSGSGMLADLKTALTLANSDPEANGKYYNLLETKIPELIHQIAIPDYLKDKTNSDEGQLWIGNGNITATHFDVFNNFYFQIKGKKIFYLYDPASYFFLYPMGSNNTEIFDIENIDFTRYPLARKIKPIKVKLSPGDFLFLPSFWWHQVESEGPYISLNYWGYPRIDECLCYPGYYEIVKHFEMGVLIQMYEKCNKSGFEGYSLTDAAELFLYHGCNWGAYMIGMSLLQQELSGLCEMYSLEPDKSIIDRTANLIERSNRQEVNLNNITFENIAEDRYYDSLNKLIENDLLSAELQDEFFFFGTFIKPSKMKDNVTISPGLVNKLILFYDKVSASVGIKGKMALESQVLN